VVAKSDDAMTVMLFSALLLVSAATAMGTTAPSPPPPPPATTTHYYRFVISEFMASPDGGVPRLVKGINGQSPAPDIIVGPGDRVVATVINNLHNGTTLHWHGIRMSTAENNMDGVPFVTQDPIAPNGGSMVYNFTVNGNGTHWYHSHYLDQYVDGLSGTIVVRDPWETNVYVDRVMFIKDYYAMEGHAYQSWFLSPASGGAEPMPVNGLLNGVTQTPQCFASKTCQYTTAQATAFTQTCGKYTTYADVLKAQAAAHAAAAAAGGSTSETLLTRMRFVAGNALVTWDVSVDGHYLWVITLDGQPVVPKRMSKFRINAAQRVDVVLCAIDATSSAPAWVRTGLVYNSPPAVLAADGVLPGAVGILYYGGSAGTYGAGAPNVKQSAGCTTTAVVTATPATWSTLLPVSGSPNSTYGDYKTPYDFLSEPIADTAKLPGLYPPPAATRQVTINFNFYTDNTTQINFAEVNGLSFVLPKTTLINYLSPGTCKRRMQELQPWYEDFVREHVSGVNAAVEEGRRGLQFGGPLPPWGTPLGKLYEDPAQMCNCIVQRSLAATGRVPAAPLPAAPAAVSDAPPLRYDAPEGGAADERELQDQALCRCVLEQRRLSSVFAAAEVVGEGDARRLTDDGSASTDDGSSAANTYTCGRRFLVGEENDDSQSGAAPSGPSKPSRGSFAGGVQEAYCQCIMHRRRLRAVEDARRALAGTAAAPASDAGAGSTERARALQECPMCMQGVHVLSYATTEVMQMVINNYDVGQHPIHLHGRRFYVLARGGKGVGAYNPNKFALNTKTPYVRDTVTIEHNSFVVIRFADKNPGLWLFRKFSVFRC
jgi:FtsP/CotA-like multicopper oxidase with cupredoxin domain